MDTFETGMKSMAKTVKLRTDSGQEIRFLVEDTDNQLQEAVGFQRRGPSGLESMPQENVHQFSSYFDPVRQLADDFATKVSEIKVKPSEVEVSVGIKLTTEAGIVFAKAGGEAEMTVKFVWKPEK